MPNETLGAFIRKRRKRRGHTQEQAAKAVRVSVITFARWERGGYPVLPMAFRLADYLGVKLEKLRRYIPGAS